jgi:hypothetical protein
MNSSTNPDTLKGYDMMITVSQDAINKQFRTLYEKEIPTAVMPDLEEIEGFAELPAAEHYINHHIKIISCPKQWRIGMMICSSLYDLMCVLRIASSGCQATSGSRAR